MTLIDEQLIRTIPALAPAAHQGLLLRMSELAVNELVAGEDGVARLTKVLGRSLSVLRETGIYHPTLVAAAEVQPGYEFGWLLSAGQHSPYRLLDVLDSLAEERKLATSICALITSAISSASPLMPFDLRGMLGERMLKLVKENENALKPHIANKLIANVNNFVPQQNKPLLEKIAEPSDGIDHTFPIPGTLEGRLQLLNEASSFKAQEARFMISARILASIHVNTDTLCKEKWQFMNESRRGAYVSQAFPKLICEDVDCVLINHEDYLVSWDQIVTKKECHAYTLAEILRLALFAGDFSLPDTTIRRTLLGGHRALLRTSGRSIVGLTAGIMYVEHGLIAIPSLFYMGREATLGKACVIDATGGCLLQEKAFLGGGLMPLLIHTHKHIAKGPYAGIDERKTTIPAAFIARKGARLPMKSAGVFECADFLSAPVPYKGIEVAAVERSAYSSS